MSEFARSLPGWVMPAGLAVLVTGLVAVALLRGPVTFDPDSPEGTVQEYLLAIDQQRWDDAFEVLHAEWVAGCDGDDIAAFAPRDFTAELGNQSGDMLGGMRFTETFTEVARPEGTELPVIEGDTANVLVTIIHDESLGGGWNELTTFELVDDDDFWWIVGDPWPYFIWNCRQG